MTIGRSLRIYLATGEPTGLRHAELDNWTGQALACPRIRLDALDALDAWPEARRPGVYMLFGAERTAEREAYIGESEDVRNRLREHVRNKEFWTEVVLFTSKDANLTKAHVRYLEHRLIEEAKTVGRYQLTNGKDARASPLPRADRDAMEVFLANIRVLLGALGHKLLVPRKAVPAEDDDPGDAYEFTVAGVTARGQPTDDGFIVFAGSEARDVFKASMGAGNETMKRELIATGKLVRHGDHYRFAEDVGFGTPSQAGSMVNGTSCNGRISWKRISDGLTLKEIEAAATEQDT